MNKISGIFSEAKKELLLVMVFALPLNKQIVPLIISLALLCWILEGRFSLELKSFLSIDFIVLVSMYLLAIVGLFYTENMQAGVFDLEQKMSLLIFPILFFSTDKIDDNFFLRTKQYFVFGALLSVLICLGNALLHYYFSYNVDSFFYVQLSVIMHPSYYALYLSYACLLILFDNKILIKTFYKIPASVVLSLVIVLLQSKSGIISIFIVFVVKLFHKFFIKKKVFGSIVILFSIVITSLTVLVVFPKTAQRMKDMITTFSEEQEGLNTTSSRIAIWKHALHLVKEKPITGYGTGDVNDVLSKSYTSKNELEMKERKFNAHNQYLQTFLALGIVGLVCLLLPYGFLLIEIYKQKLIVEFAFVILVLTNLLFEAMYETQAGIVFISFFVSLILLRIKTNSRTN